MYIVLANEVADVDLAEFEKIGWCHEGITAVPNIDVSLSIKGMRSSPVDRIEDCQNTLTLTYEPSDDDPATELSEDPFIPGIIYRRSGRDYIELKYEYRLGALTLHVYFLIDADDCSFAYREDINKDGSLVMILSNYTDLWDAGHIRGVKS